MELYRITEDMLRAIQLYQSAETDQELETAEKTLTAIQVPFKEKAISVAHHILNTNADVSAIEIEIARLVELRDRAKRHSESVQRYLKSAMEAVGEEEIKTPTLKISFRPSSAVIIDDESLVPNTYKRLIPEKWEVDKTKVKKTWADGLGVNGTHIEERTNLQIK
jgi:hypothetical protein